MKTQLELAKEGVITPQIAKVAADEGFEAEDIRKKVALGEIVIPCNPGRPHQRVVGIGSGLRTKVNASIGTSSDIYDMDMEIRKAKIAEEEGADTLMELSTGGNLDKVKNCLKLEVFVNSTNEFTNQPKVANGASDLIADVIGKHARAAVSSNSLPLGVAVEVAGTFEVAG
ncbi:MAG: hypothetical protein HC887_05630 [Desulfobacteraceae bacterium]|nr:hypothetical protein [Desulfobacteraceae bacterium]